MEIPEQITTLRNLDQLFTQTLNRGECQICLNPCKHLLGKESCVNKLWKSWFQHLEFINIEVDFGKMGENAKIFINIYTKKLKTKMMVI